MKLTEETPKKATQNVFAFMYLDLDQISDREAQERIIRVLRCRGLSPERFEFQKYDYLPERFRDSFSRTYEEAAVHLNTKFFLMVASN